MMTQRITHQNQSVRSVHQNPATRQSVGYAPNRGHRQPQPPRQQQKNGTKHFGSQSFHRPKKREWQEIERIGGELRDLTGFVKGMAGDLIKLRDYVVDQFNVRPICPPSPGQVVQVGQGFQPQGVGAVNVHHNPPVHCHTHYEPERERERGYAENMSSIEQSNVTYDYNKETCMPVYVERERESWGEEHDSSLAQNIVDHSAWHDPYYSDSYEYNNYEYGNDYEYDYEYEYDYIGVCEEPAPYAYDNPSIPRAGEPASKPVEDHSLKYARTEIPISFPISKVSVREGKLDREYDQEDDILTNPIVDVREDGPDCEYQWEDNILTNPIVDSNPVGALNKG